MNMVKRIAGTLVLPVVMFLAMMILCYSNGKMYFGTWKMWQTLIPSIAVSVTCAFGIGLQYKAGRFDFSGGSIMLLTSIIAGNIARNLDSNVFIMSALCLLLCVGFSLVVALFYVYGRIPIVITTIGMALLFESLTCLVFDTLKGQGVKLSVGSSSKNAKLILSRLGLSTYFDAVSDGTNIRHSKPDPEVFLKAAEFLGLEPGECLVVEDAVAGIDAAIAGGFDGAGLGEASLNEKTTWRLKTFSDLLKL